MFSQIIEIFCFGISASSCSSMGHILCLHVLPITKLINCKKKKKKELISFDHFMIYKPE